MADVQFLKEQELASNVKNYTLRELKASKIPQYSELYTLAQKYIKTLSDIRITLEPEAIAYLRKNYSHTYFSEYATVFINILTNLINEKLSATRDEFEKRADVVEVMKSFSTYTPSECFVFNVFFPYVDATGRLAIDTLLKNFYTRNYLGNDSDKFNKILVNIEAVYKIFNSVEDNDIAATVATSSALFETIKSFKYFSPNTTVTSPYSNGGKAYLPKTDLSGGNRRLVQTQTVVDVLSVGPIKGLVEGGNSMLYDSTPYTDINGNKLLTNIFAAFRNGYSIQSATDIAQFPSGTIRVNKEVLKSTPVTANANFKHCDYVQIVTAVDALQSSSIEQVIKIRVTDLTTGALKKQVVLADDVILGEWTAVKEFSYLYEFAESEGFPVQVEISRKNEEIVDDAEKMNNLKFSRISGIRKYSPSYPNFALVTSQYDSMAYSKEPKRQFLIDGRIVKIPSNYNPVAHSYKGDWDGTFKFGWTNNPAWVIYDLLTNLEIGLGKIIPLDNIDKYSFYNCGRYCDELMNDGEPRWTFNGVIDKADSVFNIINKIANDCRANVISTDQIIKMVIEQPQEPVYLFTNSNVIGGEFSRKGSALNSRNKRIEVKFSDPENEYKSSSVYINDVHNTNDFRSSKTITLNGCTSKRQAEMYGKYILCVEKYETCIIEFTADYSAIHLELGDVVNVADYVMSNLKTNGRFGQIVKSGQSTKVYLDIVDEHFKVNSNIHLTYLASDNELYNLADRTLEQDAGGKFVIFPKGTPAPKSFGTYTIYSDDFAPELFRITQKTITKNHLIQFTAQEYSRDKFDIAEGNKDIGLVTEYRKYAPSQVVSQFSSLTGEVVVQNEQLYLSISWRKADKESTSNIIVKDTKNNSVYYHGSTDTESALIPLKPEDDGKVFNVTISPISTDFLSSSQIENNFNINISDLMPGRPRPYAIALRPIEQLTAKEMPTRDWIVAQINVDMNDIKNIANADHYYFMFSSDPDHLRTAESELLTESTAEISVRYGATRRTQGDWIITPTFRRGNGDIERLQLQQPLLKKKINGRTVYYRPLYCKVVARNNAFGSLINKNYKDNDFGIVDLSLICYSTENNKIELGKVFYNFNNEKSFKLLTSPKNTSDVNLFTFAGAEIILNGTTIAKLPRISAENESETLFTATLDKIINRRTPTRTLEIKYLPLIGRDGDLTQSIRFDLQGEDPVITPTFNGSSLLVEILDNEAEEWQQFKTGTSLLKYKSYQYKLNGGSYQKLDGNIIVQNELEAGTHELQLKCIGSWGYSKETTQFFEISESSNDVTKGTYSTLNIPISKVTINSAIMGRPYRRSDNQSIRVIHSTQKTYRQIFTGNDVKTYRLKSNNARAWRDPQNLWDSTATIQSVISFPNLSSAERTILNSADYLMLIGEDINGNAVEKILPNNGNEYLSFNTNTKAIDLFPVKKTTDTSTLIYNILGIETLQRVKKNDLKLKTRSFTNLKTNAEGIYTITDDELSGVLDIREVNITRIASNVSAYTTYNDTASKSITVVTRNSSREPVSVSFNLTIKYY